MKVNKTNTTKKNKRFKRNQNIWYTLISQQLGRKEFYPYMKGKPYEIFEMGSTSYPLLTDRVIYKGIDYRIYKNQI